MPGMGARGGSGSNGTGGYFDPWGGIQPQLSGMNANRGGGGGNPFMGGGGGQNPFLQQQQGPGLQAMQGGGGGGNPFQHMLMQGRGGGGWGSWGGPPSPFRSMPQWGQNPFSQAMGQGMPPNRHPGWMQQGDIRQQSAGGMRQRGSQGGPGRFPSRLRSRFDTDFGMGRLQGL